MSIADTAAALGAARTAATTQQTDITKVVVQAEQAHARLRDAAVGAANALAERAVGSYADAIVKLREGVALLAEVSNLLTEYARDAGIDLPGDNLRRLPVIHDTQPSVGVTRDGPSARSADGIPSASADT